MAWQARLSLAVAEQTRFPRPLGTEHLNRQGPGKVAQALGRSGFSRLHATQHQHGPRGACSGSPEVLLLAGPPGRAPQRQGWKASPGAFRAPECRYWAEHAHADLMMRF